MAYDLQLMVTMPDTLIRGITALFDVCCHLRWFVVTMTDTLIRGLKVAGNGSGICRSGS